MISNKDKSRQTEAEKETHGHISKPHVDKYYCTSSHYLARCELIDREAKVAVAHMYLSQL